MGPATDKHQAPTHGLKLKLFSGGTVFWFHLSSSGTRGLLGCINQHIDIVESFKHCAYYGPSAKIDSAAYPRRNESRLSAPSSNNHHGRGVQHYNNAERCFKCGLTNHKTYQCRHKKQLQCYICKFYGHKDSVCWNF